MVTGPNLLQISGLRVGPGTIPRSMYASCRARGIGGGKVEGTNARGALALHSE